MNKADLKVQIWQAVSSYRIQIDPNTRDLLLADINKIIDQEDLKVGQQSTVDLERFTALENLVAGLSLRISDLSETANNHNRRLMANTETIAAIDEGLMDHENNFRSLAERLREVHEHLQSLIKVDNAVLDRISNLEVLTSKVVDAL